MAERLSAGLLVTAFVTLFITTSTAQGPGSAISSDRIFDALGLHEGMAVCEMGAGDGELSIAAARLVGTSGRVFTSELGESRVALLRRQVESSRLSQITVIEGDPLKTNFPTGACDALFMRNVYHHFDDPASMNASIKQSLKQGGRLAVADFRPRGHEAERPQDRDGGNGTHGVSADSVERELKQAGFQPLSSATDGDDGFLVVFAKGT